MNLPPSLTFPRHQKNPRTYTIPYKAARSSWYIQPYIPHSYKILVPLIKIGERSPLSTRELIEFDNRLDRQGFVKLPEDVLLYLQQRGMQHEIQVWRERLTHLRNRLKRVDFPGAGGSIILDIDLKVPRDPQHLRVDPKPLAEILEDFFGPIRRDQLTPAILMFYQKRELDRDTRVFDDWEALFWPKSLKVSVEDLPKPPEQSETLASGPPEKGQVGKTGILRPSAPLAASEPRGASRPTARLEDDIGLSSAIHMHFRDGPGTRSMPTTPGPTPWGARRDAQSAAAAQTSLVPGPRLTPGTKSAQAQRAPGMLPPVHSTPVNGSAHCPLPSGKHIEPSPAEFTDGRTQKSGSIDVQSRGIASGFTNYDKRDNLTFVLQKTNVYSNLDAFEHWVWERILTPFIVIVALYNSLLVCSLAWEWRYGSYEAKAAEAHTRQAPLRQDFNFDDSKGFRSGKLRERRSMRELDEDWPPLSTYEREREKELEWDKMAYLLELLADDRDKVGEVQDPSRERF